jgi:hypothetical protein
MSNAKVFLVIGTVLISIAIIGLLYYQLDEKRKADIQKEQIQKEQELVKQQALKEERVAESEKQSTILQQERERARAAEESRLKEVEKQKAAEKQLALLKENEKYQEEERKRTAQEERARAKQQHEDMLNRYIANRSFKNLPNSHEIAVLVIDDDRERENLFNQEIIVFLKNNNFNPTTFLFTDQFIADGIFEKIFNGNFYDISKLELYSHCDYLIIGKVATSFLENPDMLEMITAKLDLKLHVVSVQTAAATDLIVVRSKGVGFSKESAKNNALKSIFEQINKRLTTALF